MDRKNKNDNLGSRVVGGSSQSESAAEDAFGIATTAKEQLRRWDAGQSIWSIEMGGLGPGYEQAIQILAVEIMRDFLDAPLPEKTFGDWGDSTVNRLDQKDPKTGKYPLGGFSGAQVGVAKQIAYSFIKDGPRKALKTCPDDRKIQVSRFFPQAPAVS